MHQHAVVREQSSTRSSSGSSDGTCSTAYQPPSAGARGTPARPRLSDLRTCPRAADSSRPRAAESAPRTTAPRSSSSPPPPAPASTPTGRCRTRARAARARAATSRRDPRRAIHPSFTCGSPTDFDRPPSAKAQRRIGPRQHAARLAAAPGFELVVGEHFVGDDGDGPFGAHRRNRVELPRVDERSGRDCSGSRAARRASASDSDARRPRNRSTSGRDTRGRTGWPTIASRRVR